MFVTSTSRQGEKRHADLLEAACTATRKWLTLLIGQVLNLGVEPMINWILQKREFASMEGTGWKRLWSRVLCKGPIPGLQNSVFLQKLALFIVTIPNSPR